MNNDEFDDITSLLDSAGISPETQSMEEITDYLNDAGIDSSQFSEDDWNQLFPSLPSDSLEGLEGNELPIDGFDPSQLDDQNDQAHSGSKEDEDSPDDTDRDVHHEISFGAAGRCWWCSGSGVVWTGGQNQACSHCGGSGIGPT